MGTYTIQLNLFSCQKCSIHGKQLFIYLHINTASVNTNMHKWKTSQTLLFWRQMTQRCLNCFVCWWKWVFAYKWSKTTYILTSNSYTKFVTPDNAWNKEAWWNTILFKYLKTFFGNTRKKNMYKGNQMKFYAWYQLRCSFLCPNTDMLKSLFLETLKE